MAGHSGWSCTENDSSLNITSSGSADVSRIKNAMCVVNDLHETPSIIKDHMSSNNDDISSELAQLELHLEVEVALQAQAELEAKAKGHAASAARTRLQIERDRQKKSDSESLRSRSTIRHDTSRTSPVAKGLNTTAKDVMIPQSSRPSEN